MWTYITPTAVRGTIVSLCILSGLLTIARTIFRFRKFGRIYTEDIFLFIALLSLAAGTGVFYATIDGLVYEAGINGHTITPGPDFPHNYATIDVKIDTCVSLFWLSIFAVKFSFLFFFRRLIDGMSKLKIWWWFCMVVCVPCAVANAISSWIICADYKESGLQTCANARSIRGQTVTLDYGFSFDILTDLLVISLPILILRKARLQMRHKLVLGIMLCLSFFLILIAIFRYISTQQTIAGIWAFMWYLFWHDVQACVAIILVCATAFRTLFLSSTTKDSSLDSPRTGLLRRIVGHRLWPWRRSGTWDDIERPEERFEIQQRESIIVHSEHLMPSNPQPDRFSGGMRSVIREDGNVASGGGFNAREKPHTTRRADSQEALTKQRSRDLRTEGIEPDPTKGRPSLEDLGQLAKV
ncbi:MAG: hypothetical protein MMC33_006202 [Icmadophila ericetorum]|nr:hypothetical protein [Icmadophila ericetorum]